MAVDMFASLILEILMAMLSSVALEKLFLVVVTGTCILLR